MLEINNAIKIIERSVDTRIMETEYLYEENGWYVFSTHPKAKDSYGFTITAINRNTGKRKVGGPEVMLEVASEKTG